MCKADEKAQVLVNDQTCAGMCQVMYVRVQMAALISNVRERMRAGCVHMWVCMSGTLSLSGVLVCVSVSLSGLPVIIATSAQCHRSTVYKCKYLNTEPIHASRMHL